MQVGIIGAGNIGGVVARLLTTAGHETLLASRHPESLGPALAELGPRARAGTVEDAARFGRVVLLAVPWQAIPDVVEAAGGALAGRVVIDAANPYGAGGPPRRDGESSGTAVQALLPGAHVVRAFNTLGSRELAQRGSAPAGGVRTGLPLAGDDVDAKSAAAEVIVAAGFVPVDAGTLAQSRRQDPGGPLYNLMVAADALRKAIATS